MSHPLAAHKQFFNSPQIQGRIAELIGEKNRAQFVTSILTIIGSNNLLMTSSPESIYTAVSKATALNLPIEPSLGNAYIVPYKGTAQFQLGYKGLIQLAIRSGQFKNINGGKIYKSQFKSYNPLFEELEIDFMATSQGNDDEVIGYFASFELLTGFKKLTFWTKEQVEEHGKRFSRSYGNGPWTSDFDAMAIKTVLKSILSRYAPLSIEMQDGLRYDNEDSTLSTEPKDVSVEPANDNLLGALMEAPNSNPVIEGDVVNRTGNPEMTVQQEPTQDLVEMAEQAVEQSELNTEGGLTY